MGLSNRDETRTIRARHEELTVASDISDDDPDTGVPACLVKTVLGTSYPSAVNKYFLCQQVIPGGVETEGGAVTTTVVGASFPVAMFGSAVPPQGTLMIARQIGGRWEARYQ